jgi:hypothetical protein
LRAADYLGAKTRPGDMTQVVQVRVAGEEAGQVDAEEDEAN